PKRSVLRHRQHPRRSSLRRLLAVSLFESPLRFDTLTEEEPMNAPLRPTLLVLGALSLGGFVAFQTIGTAHAEPSTLGTLSIELGGKDGGHAIELGGKDGGSHAIELGGKDGGSHAI